MKSTLSLCLALTLSTPSLALAAEKTKSRIWDEYNVGVDFKGYENAKAVRWKRQNHIFQDPFYYIDYAIAETGAL